MDIINFFIRFIIRSRTEWPLGLVRQQREQESIPAQCPKGKFYKYRMEIGTNRSDSTVKTMSSGNSVCSVLCLLTSPYDVDSIGLVWGGVLTSKGVRVCILYNA